MLLVFDQATSMAALRSFAGPVAQVIAVADELFQKELGALPPEMLARLEKKLRWVLAV